MTDRAEPAGPVPKEDPEALVLRGRPRPVVRFRRGLIAGLGGCLAAGLVTLSWLALDPPSFRKAAQAAESDEPARSGGPDALARLPTSYGDVPRLGPPLPGDLGRPILEHERSMSEEGGLASESAATAPVRSRADADRERLAAARLAARSSPVLVQLAEPSSPPPRVDALPAPAAPAAPPDVPAAGPASAGQQQKVDFARPSGAALRELRPAASPWTLVAGTIIPASLVTGLNSDLPGLVLAQVSENVRDSASGRIVLVPQGSRLIGRYDSMVAYGQRRALVVWDRLLFPDGSSIDLDKMPAADASGHAGLSDGVDFHTWQLIKGIALSTLLGVGTELSLGNSESELVRAVRESAQQGAAHAGDQITTRNLDVQPTITVRPGWPVRAILNTDLVLRPWRG